MRNIFHAVCVLILGLGLNGSALAERPQSIYLMELTIGERVFNDIFMIDSTTQVGEDQNGIHESFKGSVSVPGIFSSKVYDGLIKYGTHGVGTFQITFTIDAVERGNAFTVTYTSTEGNAENGTFSGAAKIKQKDGEQELGKFKAILLVPVK